MIDPKSLRIGNWVHTSNGYEQVCDILCDSINTATAEGETLDCVGSHPPIRNCIGESGVYER